MALVNTGDYRSHSLIGQVKWKPQESCQNDVTNLSQTNNKL